MSRALILPGVALLVLVTLTVVGTEDTRAASTTVTVSWGPFAVPAASASGPGNYDTPAFNVGQPCTDCYITSIVPDFVYADGSKANFNNMAMMHHVVVFSTSAPDVTCAGTPLGSLGRRLFASGNERTALEFPEGYGLYNPTGGQWGLIMHLMNMKPEDRDMYIEFTFTYRPGSDDVRPVTPVWLDVDNCSDSEVAIPAGDSDTHWDWTPTITGDLIGAAGHVHDYGINTSLESLASGDWACNSVAGYGAGSGLAPAPVAAGDAGHPGESTVANPADPSYMGHIEEMSTCTPLFRLNAGETVRLHARYNAPAPVDDAMGIMMAFVYETTDPPDWDADGVPDASDNCPQISNAGQADNDADSVGSACDNCPDTPNATQDDWNSDSLGDACQNSDSDPAMDDLEVWVGTDPASSCAATPTQNDEPVDGTPYDNNDDQKVTLPDALRAAPAFLTSKGDPGYDQRYDLNMDEKVTLPDVLMVTLGGWLQTCAP